MSHRLGCDLKKIATWEKGKENIPSDVISQLQVLSGYVERHAEKTSREPLIESFMEEQGVDQVHVKDLDKSSED